MKANANSTQTLVTTSIPTNFANLLQCWKRAEHDPDGGYWHVTKARPHSNVGHIRGLPPQYYTRASVKPNKEVKPAAIQNIEQGPRKSLVNLMGRPMSQLIKNMRRADSRSSLEGKSAAHSRQPQGPPKGMRTIHIKSTMPQIATDLPPPPKGAKHETPGEQHFLPGAGLPGDSQSPVDLQFRRVNWKPPRNGKAQNHLRNSKKRDEMVHQIKKKNANTFQRNTAWEDDCLKQLNIQESEVITNIQINLKKSTSNKSINRTPSSKVNFHMSKSKSHKSIKAIEKMNEYYFREEQLKQEEYKKQTINLGEESKALGTISDSIQKRSFDESRYRAVLRRAEYERVKEEFKAKLLRDQPVQAEIDAYFEEPVEVLTKAHQGEKQVADKQKAKQKGIAHFDHVLKGMLRNLKVDEASKKKIIFKVREKRIQERLKLKKSQEEIRDKRNQTKQKYKPPLQATAYTEYPTNSSLRPYSGIGPSLDGAESNFQTIDFVPSSRKNERPTTGSHLGQNYGTFQVHQSQQQLGSLPEVQTFDASPAKHPPKIYSTQKARKSTFEIQYEKAKEESVKPILESLQHEAISGRRLGADGCTIEANGADDEEEIVTYHPDPTSRSKDGQTLILPLRSEVEFQKKFGEEVRRRMDPSRSNSRNCSKENTAERPRARFSQASADPHTLSETAFHPQQQSFPRKPILTRQPDTKPSHPYLSTLDPSESRKPPIPAFIKKNKDISLERQSINNLLQNKVTHQKRGSGAPDQRQSNFDFCNNQVFPDSVSTHSKKRGSQQSRQRQRSGHRPGSRGTIKSQCGIRSSQDFVKTLEPRAAATNNNFMTTDGSLKNRDLNPYWNMGDARSQSSLGPPASKEEAQKMIRELNQDVQRSFTLSQLMMRPTKGEELRSKILKPPSKKFKGKVNK